MSSSKFLTFLILMFALVVLNPQGAWAEDNPDTWLGGNGRILYLYQGGDGNNLLGYNSSFLDNANLGEGQAQGAAIFLGFLKLIGNRDLNNLSVVGGELVAAGVVREEGLQSVYQLGNLLNSILRNDKNAIFLNLLNFGSPAPAE